MNEKLLGSISQQLIAQGAPPQIYLASDVWEAASNGDVPTLKELRKQLYNFIPPFLEFEGFRFYEDEKLAPGMAYFETKHLLKVSA